MSQETRCRELLAAVHLGPLRSEKARELRELSESKAALSRMVGQDLLLDRLLRHALADVASSDEFAEKVRVRLSGHLQDVSKRNTRIRGGLSMVAALMLVSITLWATFHHSGEERKIHAAVLQLGSEATEEREEAERLLMAWGAKAEPALEEAARSKDSRLAARATSVLAILRKSQEEKDWDGRVKALPETAGTRRIKAGLEMSLKTGLEGSDLVLTDVTSFALGGNAKPFATVKTVCAADHSLNAREFSVDLTDPGTGNKSTYSGTLINGKFRIKGGPRETLEVTAKTITSPALYRLLWTLPQRAGFVLEFDLLVLNVQAQLQPGQKLKCLGEEEVEIGEKRVKAWKWEWERYVPEMRDLYAQEHYWVAGRKVVKAASATHPGRTFLEKEE